MFSERTVYELKTICMMNNLNYSKNAKKADLVKIIEDAGITYEEYEKTLNSESDYVEAPVIEKEEVSVIEETKVETKKEDKIILKMIHPRGAYNVGNGIVFTLEEPFRAFPRYQAEEVLKRGRNEIREATPEEAAAFYGVSI